SRPTAPVAPTTATRTRTSYRYAWRLLGLRVPGMETPREPVAAKDSSPGCGIFSRFRFRPRHEKLLRSRRTPAWGAAMSSKEYPSPDQQGAGASLVGAHGAATGQS